MKVKASKVKVFTCTNCYFQALKCEMSIFFLFNLFFHQNPTEPPRAVPKIEFPFCHFRCQAKIETNPIPTNPAPPHQYQTTFVHQREPSNNRAAWPDNLLVRWCYDNGVHALFGGLISIHSRLQIPNYQADQNQAWLVQRVLYHLTRD